MRENGKFSLYISVHGTLFHNFVYICLILGGESGVGKNIGKSVLSHISEGGKKYRQKKYKNT